MKKPSAKGGSKSGGDDDGKDDPWSYAARSIEPLKRRKSRVHASADTAKDWDKPATSPAKGKSSNSAAEKIKPKAAQPSPARPGSVSLKPPSAPPAVNIFDRRKARKIRTGQTEIEARIDLHGLRQDEAHAMLRLFLHRCVSKGRRWVLVITGKGVRLDRDDNQPFDMTSVRDRGVLKRNVPRWLDEPDLRALVVSYTTAAQHHGGEGALYVHLRTRGRSGSGDD